MSDSTTNLDTISQSQSQKEVTANALFDSASPATVYGRRASGCSGLTWAYYGGKVLIGTTITTIANGTLTLTGSATNYIEANATTGAVTSNTSAFTSGRTKLYTVVCGASTVTSYTDQRTTASGFLNSIAAGAVTGVSNSDGTLTISPTTGAVVASLNLGNANVWTAKQTFRTVSTSAASAPVYLPNGSAGMSTPEVGAIEVFGNQPYYTVSGPTRKSIVLTDVFVSGGIAVMTADGRLTGTSLLTWNGAAFNIPGTLTVSGLTTVSSGMSPGNILYASASNTLVGSSNLVWDNSNVRLGVGGTPADKLHVQRGTGGACLILAENTGNGTGDYAGFHTGLNGSQDVGYLTSTAPGFSASGIFIAAATFCYSTQTGGMWIGAAGASAKLGLFTGGTASTNERASIDSAGNVICGRAAIATNATDGFLYVPTCAGTPTGTPTTVTGRCPIVADSTNNKLYLRSGGSWVALN